MSFGKRFDGVGGKRCAPRQPALLPVWITTLSASRTIELINISSTGAKLRGPQLPAEGADIFIRVGPLDTLATVVWNRGETCGVTFDEPLGERDLDVLAREAKLASVTKLTPEEKLAAQDWVTGFAR